MRAVDTNIVVRYLTGDDPGQAAKAKTVIDAG
jgi:predicted nucleic-acid-binding protein